MRPLWCGWINRSFRGRKLHMDQCEGSASNELHMQRRLQRLINPSVDFVGPRPNLRGVVPCLHPQQLVHAEAESLPYPQRHFGRQQEVAIQQVRECRAAHAENPRRRRNAPFVPSLARRPVNLLSGIRLANEALHILRHGQRRQDAAHPFR